MRAFSLPLPGAVPAHDQVVRRVPPQLHHRPHRQARSPRRSDRAPMPPPHPPARDTPPAGGRSKQTPTPPWPTSPTAAQLGGSPAEASAPGTPRARLESPSAVRALTANVVAVTASSGCAANVATVHVTPAGFSLRDCVEDSVDILSRSFPHNPFDAASFIDPDFNWAIRGSPAILKRVFLKLVSATPRPAHPLCPPRRLASSPRATTARAIPFPRRAGWVPRGSSDRLGRRAAGHSAGGRH
jgi:hypothetical protein